GGDHHQVGEFVHDHQQVRVGLVRSLAAERGGELAGAYRCVEVVDVAVTGGGQVVVATVHLPHDPLEGLRRFLGAGDDGGDQVRDALVHGQFDPLGVDQDHAYLVGGGTHHQRGDEPVDTRGLTGPGGPGHQHVRHLGQVGDHVAALDVLAQAHEHGVVLGRGRRGAQDITKADDVLVGVGDLHTDRGLSGDGGLDAHVGALDRQGDVLGQGGDLLDLDRRSQFDLVAGDGRSTGVPGDVGVDLELAHHPGQGIDQFLVGLGAGLGGAARFEHGRGGQLVVTVHDTGGQGQLFGGGGRWGRIGCVGLLAGLLLRLGRLYGHLCLFFLVGEGGGPRFGEDRGGVGAFVVTRDRFGPGRLLPTLAGF